MYYRWSDKQINDKTNAPGNQPAKLQRSFRVTILADDCIRVETRRNKEKKKEKKETKRSRETHPVPLIIPEV